MGYSLWSYLFRSILFVHSSYFSSILSSFLISTHDEERGGRLAGLILAISVPVRLIFFSVSGMDCDLTLWHFLKYFINLL